MGGKMTERAGKLILFEGLTRSGKSTQVELVTGALFGLGYRVFGDREPTNGPFGRVIRAVIEKRKDAPCSKAITATWMLFTNKLEITNKLVRTLEAIQKGQAVSVLDMQIIFMADRFWHHTTYLDQHLSNGLNALCDRGVPSTLAFGIAHGVEIGELVHWHHRIMAKSYIVPALTVYVRIPPEVAVERMAKDGKVNDIFETKAGIERTFVAYEKVWEFGRETHLFGKIVEVDGNQSIPKVTEAILSEVKKALVA
jgi:thymidylate kinase